MSLRPIYLDDGAQPVFCVLHQPDSPRDVGVVICPPFGWEEMSSARSRYDWAEDLAARGYPALRIDLPGTGDSGGSPWDPGLVAAWTAAVASAATRLRAETGCRRVAAIGIGLGGVVACTAAAGADAAIDDLVLWSVPARVKSLVRELKAFSRLESSDLPGPPAGTPPAMPDGALAAGGFVMSAETIASLEALDLSDLDLHPRRALLLERDGRAPDERLREALVTAGTDVTVAAGDGYREMLIVEPQQAHPPLEVFDRVGAWLDEAAPAVAPFAPAAAAGGEVSVELGEGGERVRETVISFDQPAGRLVGVLAEPLGDPAPMTVVLLNAGAQRRIGPNRMWVEMARRWAARGIPTLRLDLGGIGDAEGDASAYRSDAGFYVPEFVGQARAALDVLEARGLPRRFVLGGLCSGAYWSLYGAVEDERVAAALMLNPRALTWDSESLVIQARREAQALGRRLTNPRAWGRLVRGQVSLERPLSIARKFVVQLLRAPLRLRARLAARRQARASGADADADATDIVFNQLRDRGKRGHMVFVGREPLHEDYKRARRMERFGEWPNITLELLELGADMHTLRPIWLQREVHAMADRAIERELDAARADTHAPSVSAGR
jgi:alpha-beta hydrolase superfamily lysophospholipase